MKFRKKKEKKKSQSSFQQHTCSIFSINLACQENEAAIQIKKKNQEFTTSSSLVSHTITFFFLDQ